MTRDESNKDTKDSTPGSDTGAFGQSGDPTANPRADRGTGLNTDSRGGPGSAREAGREDAQPSADTGLFDTESTEPRSDTRIGKPSSQGLTGAQGSGGGADPADSARGR